MPEIAITAPAAAPAAKATVVNPTSGTPFTPIAVRLPVKARATATKLVKELAPPGQPDPAILKVAQTTALALIESFDETVTGVEVVIESNAGKARQLMVLVIPHEL